MFERAAYDRLLTARTVGCVVRHRPRTSSTMNDARAGAAAGGACGTAYIADAQDAGRGRQGREWFSEPGAGLYVTYHVCDLPLQSLTLAPAAAGLAVCDAVAATSEILADLKWPNDVLVHGRKLAGLLVEATHGRSLDVFIGIGINLRSTGNMPTDVAALATSLEAVGAAVPSPASLLAALSGALEKRLETLATAPAQLRGDWAARLVTIGKQVRVTTADKEVEGLAFAVSERGELLVRDARGDVVACAAGDVVHARPFG